MNNSRRYQRYTVSQDAGTPDQFEVIVEGELVRLVHFSVGGLYILSKLFFPFGETINILVNFRNHGKIELTGTIVRVRKEGEMWGIAIDLSKNYNLDTLQEV
jgi:Tfp pilus assembly protein PilZ